MAANYFPDVNKLGIPNISVLDENSDFKWVSVSDVKCIVWNTIEVDNVDERKQRKARKDIIGGKFPDTDLVG